MENSLHSRIMELTSQVRIRPGRPTEEDAKAFANLLNSQYTRKIAPHYYFWQFFRSPQPSVCLFAEEDGRTVGTYGLWALKRVGAIGSRIGLCVDLAVSPPFRGAGLFVRLEEEMEGQAKKLGCLGIYAAANLAAYRPRVCSLGWSSVRQIATATVDTSRVGRGGMDVSITGTDRFGAEADGIFGTFLAHHPQLILSSRASEYLNWRFGHNPRYVYESFVVRRNARALGYLVLKTFKEPESGLTYGDIVDLLWGEDDPDLLEQMVQFAVAHFYSGGLKQAAIWLQTKTILDDVARAFGFSETDQHRYVCSKVFDPQYEWLQDGDRWFITMADSEVY